MDYEIGDRVQFRLDGDKNNVKDGTVITEENDSGEFNVEYEDDWGTKKIIAFNRSRRKAGFHNIDAEERQAQLPTRPPQESKFAKAMKDATLAEVKKRIMPYAVGGTAVFLFWWFY